MEIITKTSWQTKYIGKLLGQEILTSSCIQQTALVFALSGNLGSGKTTFIQGVAQGLGIKENITSPTFVIMKKYNIKHPTSNIKHLYHMDCYRINSRALLELDFKEIVSSSGNIVIIEWAEKVKKILPKNSFWFKFEYLNQDKRKIIY